MKAAIYRGTGPSTVLSVEEIDTPDPGPGEVRVKVAYSGVNPTDWKSRSGATGASPKDFQVPHQDGSGVVDAIGEGVTARAVGQRVWLYLAASANPYGTAAEYSVVPAGRTVPLPDSASDELGACLGVPALTAAHCLGGHPEAMAGAHVLVAGGAGAVGHYAIELAKHAGAWVVTTVSSEEKARLAAEAGADLVVNYRAQDAVAAIRAWAPDGVDRIVEVAVGANAELDAELIAPGREISSYGAPDRPFDVPRALMVKNGSLRFVLVYTMPEAAKRQAVEDISEALGRGALSALPALRFPLEQIDAAHEAVREHAVGKVLVEIP